jgi:glucose/mannose-6-phosphate isomerase
VTLDDGILADPERLVAAGGAVLAATASAGAQLRAGVTECDRDVLGAVIAAGRPRAVVVMGAGGSSAAGEVLSACAGRGSSVPVVTIGGPGLPGWVGPLDLVIALSASGSSPETLAVAAEAGRRGCHLVGVSGGGDLVDAVRAARGSHLTIGRVAEPVRARLLSWRLAAPLLLLGQGLGIVDGGESVLAAAADALDEASELCGPGVDFGLNIAKDLALGAAEGLSLFWGTPGVPAAAAKRAGRQLAENAGLPSHSGSLPEVARTHARVLTGTWGADDGDIFRDRVEHPDAITKPRLVLLSDSECDALSAELSAAVTEVAAAAGVPVDQLVGGDGHPLLRLVRLTQPLDLASVYAAGVVGADPVGSAAGLHPSLGSGS